MSRTFTDTEINRAYDWHPVVALRWSVAGNLQQHWKRRVSNSRGVWYDEFEWRDVPRQSVDDIPVFPYPAQETKLTLEQRMQRFPAGGWVIEIGVPFSAEDPSSEHPLTFRVKRLGGDWAEFESLDMDCAVTWLEQQLGLHDAGGATDKERIA